MIPLLHDSINARDTKYLEYLQHALMVTLTSWGACGPRVPVPCLAKRPGQTPTARENRAGLFEVDATAIRRVLCTCGGTVLVSHGWVTRHRTQAAREKKIATYRTKSSHRSFSPPNVNVSSSAMCISPGRRVRHDRSQCGPHSRRCRPYPTVKRVYCRDGIVQVHARFCGV